MTAPSKASNTYGTTYVDTTVGCLMEITRLYFTYQLRLEVELQNQCTFAPVRRHNYRLL